MVLVHMSLSYSACKHVDCSVFKEYLTCAQVLDSRNGAQEVFLLETDMEVQNRK